MSPAPDEDTSGYVLPPVEPDQCDVTFGNIEDEQSETGYAGVVSATGDRASRSEIRRAVTINVNAADEDREVAPDEEHLIERQRLGRRTVRANEATGDGSTPTQVPDEVTFDWFENGWLSIVRVLDADRAIAGAVIEHMTVPAPGGSPDDVSVDPPEGTEVVAESVTPARAGSYVVTAGGCESGDHPPVVTMGAAFVGDADPRAFLQVPGPSALEEGKRGDYWVSGSGREAVWKEGNAVIRLLVNDRRSDLADYADDVRRVSRADVEEWIEKSEAERP